MIPLSSRRSAVILVVCAVLATTTSAAECGSDGKMKFSAIHFLNQPSSASYGTFTPNGPKLNTLRPLPKGIRLVAEDPISGTLFGLGLHEVYQVQLSPPRAIEIKMPDNVPRLSWPCGMAFDTKRQRLFVASLGGEGHLYAYGPRKNRWSVVAGLHNIDLAAITYDADRDILYGLHQPYRHKEGPILCRFNNRGAVVENTPLKSPVLAEWLHHSQVSVHTQLNVYGDCIIAVLSKTHWGREVEGETTLIGKICLKSKAFSVITKY